MFTSMSILISVLASSVGGIKPVLTVFVTLAVIVGIIEWLNGGNKNARR